MAKPKKHPAYYYTIRDKIVAQMGPAFNRTRFRNLFPSAAVPHEVIPYTDGYLAHRRIIEGLVEAEMKSRFAGTPKTQMSLV